MNFTFRADNLIEGHNYNFRVRAVNKIGESLPLNTFDSITAKDPYGKPDKPGAPVATGEKLYFFITTTHSFNNIDLINLHLTDWGKSFVDLEWKPPKKDGGSEITSYIIEKREKYG